MTAILTKPDEGERIHWPQQGHDFCLKVSSESGSSFSLTEAIIPPGKGAGLHIHDDAEECWYVLDGEYRFTVGDAEFTAGAGATVLVPRGTPHGLMAGETGGRHLTIFAPGGCEVAFREIGAAQRSGSTGPDFFKQRPPVIAVMPIAGSDAGAAATAAAVTVRLVDGLTKIESIRVMRPEAGSTSPRRRALAAFDALYRGARQPRH